MSGDYGWISLTSDFGTSDGFVAALRGVVATRAPTVGIIDVTHDVPPGDIRRGAHVLAQTIAYLPRAVHVAIVDPGVGTARRAIAVETAQGILVGPDNGLLLPAADALGGAVSAVALTNPEWHAATVSATFHGRDVFAPVAARLAGGAALADAGPAIAVESLVRLPEPRVAFKDGHVEAEVLSVDRFGNVQLAVSAGDGVASLGEGEVLVGGLHAVCGTTFGDVQPGAMVVFGDSAGYLAIAVNHGLAVVALGVEPGDVVRLDRV